MPGLPSGSGSLAMESSRRHRLNVSDWQAWWDKAHLEDAEKGDAHVRRLRRPGDVRVACG